MKNLQSFNVNDSILIKLKERGYEMLVEDHNQYISKISNYKPISIEDIKAKENEDGLYVISMWECMNLFGSQMFNGQNHLPFETTIYFEKDSFSETI